MSTQKSPYASKFWTNHYDDFVQKEIKIEVMALAEMLKQTAKEFPNHLVFEFMGTVSTYKEFEKKVISFANFLVTYGVKKGDCVAIQLPNSPQYLIALFGAFYTGCTVTGMSFLLKPIEVIYQLKDSGAVAVLTMDSFYEESVRTALASGETKVKIAITTNITDCMGLNPMLKWLGKKLKKIPVGVVEPVEGIKSVCFKEIIEKYPGDKAPDVKIDPYNDLAFLQYTGGTTGPPKGAMLTHANMSSNLQQTLKLIEKDAVKGKEIFISGFPVFHLAGMFLNLGSMYYAGMQLLIPDPRNVKHITKLIAKWRPSVCAMVPTLYLMLMNYPPFRELDFSSLRGFISGAAPFASETIREFESIIKKGNGNGAVMELYGLTETSPIATSNPYLGVRKIGTVGMPIPNTEMKLVDVEEKTKEVPIGEPGEVVIKGPQVFKGYWNKPEETKNALRDGWLYTGDIGVMDEDGYLKIVDRTKDMIIVSGYKVFSVEVDDKMKNHPAIELCSTIGVPDPSRPGSEIVKLFVKLKAGQKNTLEIKEDILKYARDNLATYKVPKLIEISDDIPLTVIGKIDKKVLRAREQEKAKKSI